METSIPASLLILWSTIIVPAIIVLLVAFFFGRLTAGEDRRYLPIREDEPDWWDTSETKTAEGGAVR